MELVKTYIESLEAEGRKSLRMKKLPLNPNDLTVGEAVFLANYCAKLMQTETWYKMKQADATSNNK
jgi:hypothetical protein